MLAVLLFLCSQALSVEPPVEDTSVPPVVEAETVSEDAPGSEYLLSDSPGQVTPKDKYWDLEILYHEEKHAEGQKIAEEMYAKTKDPHLTMHIARFAYQQLEGAEDVSKDDRLAIYERALAVLDEGLVASPKDAHLKFARAAVIARIGTTRGILASLRSATDVENSWLETVDSNYTYRSIGNHEQLPCDGYLALGIFYRLVPDWWVIKMISGTRGDLNKSLEMNLKGVKCAPTTIRNLKELGVTQLCLGERDGDEALITAGKASINRYLAIEPTMEAEVLDIKHGIMLLKDHSMACGYSRDGQQELDEAKLKE